MQSCSSHNRYCFKKMKSRIPPRSSTIKWMYFTTSVGYSHKWYQPTRINLIETFVGANRPPWFGHVSWMPDTRIIMYLLKWTLCNGQISRVRKNWLNSALKECSVFLESNTLYNVIERLAKLVEHANTEERWFDLTQAGVSWCWQRRVETWASTSKNQEECYVS